MWLANPVFLSAICSWFLAQIIKTLISGVLKKELHGIKKVLVSLFWHTGGMPSSHAGLVTSIAMSIGITEGLNSSIFILALVFAIVVIRDTVGVRLSAGQQAEVLNKLGKSLEKNIDVDFTIVKEVRGHTLSEVVLGILLGIAVSLVISLL